MITLLDKVIEVASGLTAGELFNTSDNFGQTAGQREISYYKAVLPSLPDGQLVNNPLCLAKELPASIIDRTYGVALCYALHNEDYAGAQADLDRLKTILMGLYEQASLYLPCQLESDKSFVGDEDGYQPHPEYYYTVEITFTRL